MTTALVTGASTGIGAVFAEVLAARGHDLILVARSQDKLDALAAKLRADTGRVVTVIAADLVAPQAAESLAKKVASLKLEVHLLINNAGFGNAGPFVKHDAAADAQMVALNCGAVVGLIHAFAPAMVARGSGGIINVASIAGFQPTPYMALYGATKAFVLSLSESLAEELGRKGVSVTALCPGPVDTPFFEVAGTSGFRDKLPKGVLMSARPVVEAALAGFAAGHRVVVPGAPNRLATFMPRLLPRRVMAKVSAKIMGH